MSQFLPEAVASPAIERCDQLIESFAGHGEAARPVAHRHRVREGRRVGGPTGTPCRSPGRHRRGAAPAGGALWVDTDRRRGPHRRPAGTKAAITLEPGGQLELSGQQCESVHCAQAEFARARRGDRHRRRRARHRLSRPRHAADQHAGEIEWVPKRRYRIMGPYMARVGTLGQRMMKQTATVQVNIDYDSERDAMIKMRVGMGIAPAAHGDVRQLAAQRRTAERLPLFPRPHLDRHRPGALRPVAVRLPRACGFRIMSSMRSMCRCTSSSATAVGRT